MIDFTLAMQRDEMIQTLCGLLRVKSVKSPPQNNMPYGKGVFNALIYMLNLAEAMDFDSVNLYSHVGYVEYGDGDEMLAILTHLDVMPEGKGWTVPAFDGTVKDGKVYGRGAIDNKGPAVAALYALSALKENCVTLNKRVRLIFGCDEESGWSDLAFYKESGGELPTMAISPDAEFPIINAEKGLLQLELKKEPSGKLDGRGVVIKSLSGGERVNAVPAECECVLTADPETIQRMAHIFNEDAPVKVEYFWEGGDRIRLRTKGLSAHGSRPDMGVNAVAYMIMFLNQLPLTKNHISDTVYELATYVALQTDGRYLGIACSDEYGPLTLNLGYLHAGESGVRLGLDIRYPISADKNKIVGTIREKLKSLKLEEKFWQPAHYVPEDSPLIVGLKQAYEEMTGEPATCLTTGGATYARAFDNSVAFGPLFPGQVGTEHQADEYIEIESFTKLADIIADAVVVLCSE